MVTWSGYTTQKTIYSTTSPPHQLTQDDESGPNLIWHCWSAEYFSPGKVATSLASSTCLHTLLCRQTRGICKYLSKNTHNNIGHSVMILRKCNAMCSLLYNTCNFVIIYDYFGINGFYLIKPHALIHSFYKMKQDAIPTSL